MSAGVHLGTNASSEPGVLRVEAVFHDVDESQADTIAAALIGRAHELANLPECECDVDVNVRREASDTSSARSL